MPVPLQPAQLEVELYAERELRQRLDRGDEVHEEPMGWNAGAAERQERRRRVVLRHQQLVCIEMSQPEIERFRTETQYSFRTNCTGAQYFK